MKYAERNLKPTEQTRYVAVKKLMERGFSHYENAIIGDRLEPIESFSYEHLEPNDIDIYPRKSMEVIKLKEDKIKKLEKELETLKFEREKEYKLEELF